ncbi:MULTISPECIES: PBP1A family penicillin-binding protein [unclassified Clostridium]|uniref:transglycosylase domain-containing protein n=1 Tax=unclassified Clostridium TaxID=2614128 RepID=UPI0002973003|nr:MULTISPECIES: PBP1A family penicillin-binding protein [unclassified Clostridium]EKQ51057.1 MAG: penicillin-binding protein, 1A family [Clostridium sp. Maddingley MBC34-26]
MAINDKAKKADSTPRRRKPVKTKQKKSHKIFKGVCFGLLFCFLAIGVVVAGYAFAIIKTTPPLNVDAVLSLNQPSSLYDSNGDFMDNLHSDEERYVVDSSKIPANLKNAFVSIEDERFYKHNGVDFQRIAGSAYLDVRRLISGQKGLQGASTLTQQLIKNTILTNDVSIERKVREAYLAISLEERLTKDQILTAYLNTIPLGGHVYGVEAASLSYFGKSASDLSLIECAYIAGITQAPSYYSAYNENNQKDPSPYINRTLTVLSMMHKLEYISDADYDKAVNDVKNGGLVFKSSKKDYRLNYEWFVYPAVSQVKEDLKAKYNYSDDEASKLMVNGGLKIYTTMNRSLQDFTQATLDDYSNLGISNGESYDKDGVPLLQASATIMDYRTGRVIAMVGGRGKQQPQSTNRAYNDLRPIGSSTKPLTVYGPGIDQKIITAATPIDDAPIPEEIGKKYVPNDPYNPLNSPNEYAGIISARDALTHSKNTAAVLMEDKIGLKTGISYGQKLGLKYNSASKTSIAALALGQFNNDPNDRDGGNTYILAGAYGAFGNSGIYTKPVLYTKVVDSSGKIILDNSTPKQTKVFSPQAAYILYDMLKGPVTEYNATGAKFGDMPVAGKTGTTTNSTDLWFAGLTPYLSGSVWLGYDKPKQLLGSSSGAAVIWGKLMKEANKDFEVKDIDMPSGIVSQDVCKDSGLLPSSICSQDPRGNRVDEELFIEGTEPTTTCTTHVIANVNRFTNKLASSITPSILTKSSVFIKKDHPNPATADYFMVLPSSYDTSGDTPPATDTTESTPSPATNANGALPPPIVNGSTPAARNGNNTNGPNINENNTHNPIGPGGNSGTLSPISPSN